MSVALRSAGRRRFGEPAGLLVGSLATWRVSHLLVEEEGPGQVLNRLRAAVNTTPLTGLLDCFGCTSVWVGLVAGVATYRHGAGPTGVVLRGLAMSGAAFLAQKLISHTEAADWLPEPEIDSPLVTRL